MAENTPTPNYGFNLPLVGGDDDVWGDLLNANWESIDTILWTVSGVANAALTQGAADGRYLQLTGGTMGPNSTIFNGPAQFNNYIGLTSTVAVSGNASFTGGATFGTAQVFFNSVVTFSADALMVTPPAADNSSRAATTSWVRAAIAAIPAPTGYLPLTGGTLTGPLFGTSATFSGAMTAPADIINGPNTSLRYLAYQTNSSNRWLVAANVTAESGANAGSDFSIQSYSDSGALIGTPHTINRASGYSYFNGNGATPLPAETGPFGHSAIRMNKAGSALTNVITGHNNGVMRWALTMGGATAESGSNVGSDFSVQRFSDAGAALDAPLTINRANGVATFSNTINTPLVNINAAAGTSRPLFFNTSGVARWVLYATATAESGGNAGSDFQLQSYNDAGTFLASPLVITRSTGLVSMTGVNINPNGISYKLTGGSYLAFAAQVASGGAPYLQCYSNGALIGGGGVVPFSNAGLAAIIQWGVGAGATSIQAYYGGGATVSVSWATSASDRKLKSNIEPSSADALALVNQLNVVSCDMAMPGFEDDPKHWDCALIADEVDPIIPRAFIAPPPPMDPNSTDERSYASLAALPIIATLVKAVQQLTERVETLEAQLAARGAH